MARWTSRLTTVRFEDSLGAGLTIGPGAGDLSTGEENAENAEHIRKLDRGVFDGFVIGDDLEQDVSITVELENASLTDATADRVKDFVMKRNKYSGATSLQNLLMSALNDIMRASDELCLEQQCQPVQVLRTKQQSILCCR